MCNCKACRAYAAEVQEWVDVGGLAAFNLEVEEYQRMLAREYDEHLRAAVSAPGGQS